MVFFPLFAFFSVFSFAEGNVFKAPIKKTPVMTKVPRRERAHLRSPRYLRLPVYLDSRLPLVDRQHFSPVRGTGHELLPDSVREVLLPAPPPPAPPGAPPASVTTSCQLNKMVVQVPKSVLNRNGAHDSRLKLGTCHASNSTKNYIYFKYDLSLCGTKSKMIDNRVVYSNILQFNPPKLQGPIRRIAPFTLPVACHFNRYQYSYKVGYTPKMQMRKIFKAMRNRVKFTLTARNAQWERLTPSDPYVLGQPMYFEAEGPSMSKDQRLYIHSCYTTQNKSHTSKPQFPVVNNFGCMVESKEARSRFHPHKNNAVRFSVDAFVFKGMTEEQLYMHCTMSTGSSIPTPTMKSCNYDTKAGRWVELHGKDVVCDCCDSACTPAAPVETKMISSRPWTIKPKLKPPATLKRKTVSTTTTTTTTTTTKTTTAATTTTSSSATTTSSSATTPVLMTAREVTERTTTPQTLPLRVIPATLRGKVEDVYLPDLRWPFRGKGVTWVEEEVEEKSVRGSAVVGLEEEEEEDGEEITEPYRTFEDIFEFE